jgi:kinetochore protein Mis12/MTW1
LIDDIINSVNNLVYQGTSSLENGLTATPPARLGFKPSKATPTPADEGGATLDYPQAKQEIEEGLHQLETLLESTVDKNFDKFEIYVLRNILSVPEELARWIRLSHYEVCIGLCFLTISSGSWSTRRG